MKQDVKSIRKAVGFGLGFMAAIVALCAALMIGSVEFVERRAANQKWAYERELAISLAVEKNAVKMVDRSALFELSGSELDFKESQSAFEALKRNFADARHVRTDFGEGGNFGKSIDAIEKKATTYGAIILDVKKVLESLRKSSGEAETAGKEFVASIKHLSDLASSTPQVKQSKLSAAFEAKSLAEFLLSRFYATQSSRNSMILSADLSVFNSTEENLKKFEQYATPSEMELLSITREKSKSFKEALETYIRSLGDYGLVADARMRSGVGVLTDASKLADEAVNKANEAATESLNTLWLVSVFVLIATAIAIVSGIFIAVIVLRKLDSATGKEFGWLERKASEIEAE